MARTAKDYPVTFGYGAYDGTFYTKTRPHRGNDRPTPTGTPVVIEGVTIGLTGNTGLSSAPHLHTQAGNDFWAQNTVNPTPYDFKPGKVVHTGFASQWGNHVIIQTTNGMFVVYAHLNKITAKIGQVIKEESVKIGTGQNWKNRMNRLHRQLVRNANMSESVFKSIQGKDAWSVVESWSDHPESNTLLRYQEIGQAATKGNWEARLKAADEALKANAKTIEELKATIETTTTKTKAEKDALIDQIATLTESLKATQEKYEEAKKQTNIVVDVGGDTQSWLEKLINLFRR